MRFKRQRLTFTLDEGVPNAVGRRLQEAGHKVIYLNKGNVLPRGSKDSLVCAFAVLNDAILVAIDGDMRAIAKAHGATGSTYANLNLLKLSCLEPEAAKRVKSALSLIEHEWYVNENALGRRIFVEILNSAIRTNR